MVSILQSLSKTIHISLLIAITLLLGLHFGGDGFVFDRSFFSWLFRYLHVLTGIMWIGLLWYFNFVQIPSMPNIPDEQKPAIGKVIAPRALFWFRWAALGTIITGLIVSYLQGYAHQAMTLGIGSGGGKNADEERKKWDEERDALLAKLKESEQLAQRASMTDDERAKETALARVRSIETALPGTLEVFLKSLLQVSQHVDEWSVADEVQSARISRLTDEIQALRMWCENESNMAVNTCKYLKYSSVLLSKTSA